MAGQGKKPNFVQNFLGRIGDRVIPGNNWDPNTGTWTATPVQYLGGVGGVVGNMLAPGLGNIIRSGTHGATTGEGMFGFLQRGGNFQGNPVNPMTFNPQFGTNGAGTAGTQLVPLTPANPINYVPPTLNPTQRFNQGAGGNQGNSFLGGRGPSIGGMAGLTGIGAQMGGARGAYGGGGYTGDAARALFASMRGGPMNFSTYTQTPHNQ